MDPMIEKPTASDGETEAVVCAICGETVVGRVRPHQRIAIPRHGSGECASARLGWMEPCECEQPGCPDRSET